MERLALLISGSGTTMEAIVKACQSGEIPMEVACVVSSNPKAEGVKKASRLGIEVVTDRNLLEGLQERKVTVVTQNGWLIKTPKSVIDAFPNRIFNQHPGPKFETRATHGLQPHAIMLYLARHTGRNLGTEVVIHRVNKDWDSGPTVAVARVSILDPYESPEVLQARALPFEHRLQIDFLKLFARGQVKEIPDTTSYIQSGEEQILIEARKYAREKYPRV